MSARDVISQCLWHHATTPTADAILTALRAAGYVVVPREPTDEMMFAGAQALAMEMQAPSGVLMGIGYAAMLSAAEGDAP
jgi:hypothetical protein